jgi:hypothetical protein
MAEIDPIGVDRTTGQARALKAGDTLTDNLGNPITGLQGVTGFQGFTGSQGFTGLALGATGVQGVTGFQGITGSHGFTGLALGATGVQGLTGIGVTSKGLGHLYQVATGSISVPANSCTSPGDYIQVQLLVTQSGSGGGSITFNTPIFSWTFGAVSGYWGIDLKIFYTTSGQMSYAAGLHNAAAGTLVLPTITSAAGTGNHTYSWPSSGSLVLSMTGGIAVMHAYAHSS